VNPVAHPFSAEAVRCPFRIQQHQKWTAITAKKLEVLIHARAGLEQTFRFRNSAIVECFPGNFGLITSNGVRLPSQLPVRDGVVRRCFLAFTRSLPSPVVPRTFDPYAWYKLRQYRMRVVPRGKTGVRREIGHQPNCAQARLGLKISHIRHCVMDRCSAHRHFLGISQVPERAMTPGQSGNRTQIDERIPFVSIRRNRSAFRPFPDRCNLFRPRHAQRPRRLNFPQQHIRRKLLLRVERRIQPRRNRLLNLRA
jgi:hypothetical protein